MKIISFVVLLQYNDFKSLLICKKGKRLSISHYLRNTAKKYTEYCFMKESNQ